MVDWGGALSHTHKLLYCITLALQSHMCGAARGGTRAFPAAVLNDRAELEKFNFPNRANYLSFSTAIAVVQYGVVEERI